MSKTIGAYSVLQAIDQDGEAYLAKSAEGRTCTIRVVDVPPDDERLERVRAETLACAAIVHPAVAVIADVIEHDGKTAIVGPPPVDGVTLDVLIERLGDKTLSDDAIWYLGLQVASAVALAHGTEVEGDFVPVCHGHLSPKQISVGFDGTVRVEGVGLGQLVGEKGLVAEEAYTAPEQRGGGRVTPRGDIYSVAAILWQLLSGEEPHEGMSVADVAERVPDSFVDPFGRCLESKVSQRRITSMEIEQFLGDLVDAAPSGAGKKALVDTMAAFKKGGTLLGQTRPERTPVGEKEPPRIIKRPGDDSPITKRGGSTGRLGGALAGRAGKSSSGKKALAGVKLPPIRSKQSTLSGGAGPPRARMDSKPIDWDEAAKSASDTISPPAMDVVDDELSWGIDEDDDAAKGLHAPIQDEDSDEELTMMNPAGAELRAAMDEAKAKRDSRGTARSVREEPTPIKSRSKLEREARGSGPGEPPKRPSGAGAPPPRASSPGAPPRPTGSGRGLPPPRGSDPGRVSSPEVSADPKKKDESLMRTMASAGVEKEDEPPVSTPRPMPVIEVEGPSDAPDVEVDEPQVQAAVESESEEARRSEPEPAEEREVEPAEVKAPAAPEPKPAPPVAEKPSASVEATATPGDSEGDGSPWSKAEDTAPEEVERELPKSLMALIAIVSAVVVMVVGVFVWRHFETVGPPPSLPSVQPTAAKTTKPKPAAKPSAAPSPTPGASASASAAASGAVAPPDVDASKLAPTLAYLHVEFSADPDATVSVLGKDIGKVNTPIEVSCTRALFVRIKSARGIWLSDGKPVNVKCQALNKIAVKPSK